MRRLLTLPALVLSLVLAATAMAEEPFAVYRSKSSHEDVMEALKMAIQDRGMYINNVMHMGEMLERTGRDLGMEEKIYGHAESIEFCSAILSRKMTSENPARIVNCPFIISVYTLPDDPDTTYIVHRKVWLGDEQGVMQEVAEMLRSLGAAAAEGF
jgi:uncharacterized protein (DUF302 family)